jgi:adenylate cyclase
MTDTPDTQAFIEILSEQDAQAQSWPLHGKSAFTLGRVADNDVSLPWSWVSRKHAMIQAEENGRLNLIDLGSSNGTFVNGRRIYTPVCLENGDCIGIGNTRLLFHQTRPSSRPQQNGQEDLEEMTVAFVQKTTITILICDIHDYTRLSELLGDQHLSQLLQYWTGKVTKLVNSHGGQVDKFIGDAVMALWAGTDLRHNIRQAMKTALAINTCTARLGEKIPDLPWPLATGAALNTGEAMLGNLAQDGGRSSYTVVGDVVNVAFRLEDMTDRRQDLDFLMGGEAAAELVAAEKFCKKYSFQLKGRKESVEALGCSFTQLAAYLKQSGKDLKNP